MSKNSFFVKNHMFGMPVCIQKLKNQWVLCSHMILQCKTRQRNLTASKLSKYNYPYKLHTFKEKVTKIDFLVRPGPNVPYMTWTVQKWYQTTSTSAVSIFWWQMGLFRLPTFDPKEFIFLFWFYLCFVQSPDIVGWVARIFLPLYFNRLCLDKDPLVVAW